MKKDRTPEPLKIDRAEAAAAKRALQELLDELEYIKRYTNSTERIQEINSMQGKARVGITALRDADGNEASVRKTEVRGRRAE